MRARFEALGYVLAARCSPAPRRRPGSGPRTARRGSACTPAPARTAELRPGWPGAARAGAGTTLWSSGFLKGVYQGTTLRSSDDPVLFLAAPPGQDPADRRRILDAVCFLNRRQPEEVGDPEIETRIRQYELAHRMRVSVPELMDLSQEPSEALKLYGAKPNEGSFAGNCLLARRLLERGVRVVELYDADWDHHTDIAGGLPYKCQQVDQASAALVQDLKRLGMLEDTLVIWGG